MELAGKSRQDICKALGISYYTVADWCNGKKYPRMDKVEMLANYFGILKSDLIEEKLTEEKQKDNELLAKIIVRARTDEIFRNAVYRLHELDSSKLNAVTEMLKALGE